MRRRRISLPLAFAAFGVLWGVWQALLPELAGRWELSTGPLGVILTAGFAVSLPIMLGTGRALDRLGPGPTIAIPAAAMASALVVVGASGDIAVLVAGIVLLAAASGAYDVAINGAAMADEGWSRPARMTMLHAAFSAGGLAGALAGGLAASADVALGAMYLGVALAMLTAAALTLSTSWAATRRERGVPRVIAVAMLPLAAIAALAFLTEGSMETWSAIYLRDGLGAAAFIGALGPASFHAAMLAGRLFGAAVAGALGPRATLLVAGLMIVGGMAVALVVTAPAAAIPGMAIAALGASFVVPVVVSVAARRAGPHAGRAASYVLTLGYAGFLVGPSLVGLAGEVVGLRLALVVVPVAGAMVALGSRMRTPATR